VCFSFTRLRLFGSVVFSGVVFGSVVFGSRRRRRRTYFAVASQ
jgi:hypothetical protein